MNNPQLSAVALLVRKFGKKIPGGGYEVEVSHEEMKDMSRYGTFQEVPELDRHLVKWQYFPNPTVDGTPISVSDPITPESVTPESVAKTSCNRHADCEKAEEELLARNPGMKKSDIHLNFHCHDDECEDCFGK